MTAAGRGTRLARALQRARDGRSLAVRESARSSPPAAPAWRR
jgi:hypothetical protein